MIDKFVGQLTFIRVYSGILSKGSSVYNSTKKKTERITRLVRMHANKREEIDYCEAGNICAVVGLKFTTTGDTLCDDKAPILLEKMEFPAPVISIAIEPRTKADQDKLGVSLARLAMEDPSFSVKIDEETGQTLISGMGELHLEIIVDRLRREYEVNANIGKPQVAYRETITATAEAENKYIRQTGGRGQYGHVCLRISPAGLGAGLVFENNIIEGRVPKEFIPAIHKGIEDALQSGIRVGYPIVDIKVELYDGSFHEVDSTEIAYKIAASMAFKEACLRAVPVLLEPVMGVEVVTPDEYMGNVVGDLSRRRGKIMATESRVMAQIVRAEVPLAEMFGYVNELRSMSKGQASYTMAFAQYEVVPSQIAENIILRMQGGI